MADSYPYRCADRYCQEQWLATHAFCAVRD